jgi:glycosyltransferase involved in cell wall biosynthesis
MFKRLRGQRYVIVVYDIYPDILIRFGKLKESGLIARLWRRMNRLVWENAEIVFTIGEKMAANLAQNFDTGKTSAGKVVVISNWADTDWIRPLPKDKNEFAIKYGQLQKLTVMYSGNLGNTHDIETFLAAAKKLRKEHSIHFMIIGEGAKSNIVEKAKLDDNLENLTILPFQPESVLPLSLPTADISVITLDKGGEGLSVPSKTHYYMAAGSVLLGLCDENSEIGSIICEHNCGIVTNPGEASSMAKAILELLHNQAQLREFRVNSRIAAEKYYSRKNTSMYVDVLSAIKFQKDTNN